MLILRRNEKTGYEEDGSVRIPLQCTGDGVGDILSRVETYGRIERLIH